MTVIEALEMQEKINATTALALQEATKALKGLAARIETLEALVKRETDNIDAYLQPDAKPHIRFHERRENL